MKAIIEILKEMGSILFAGIFGLIGLALANVVIGVCLWYSDGNIAWRSIIVGIAFVVLVVHAGNKVTQPIHKR